MENTLGSYVQNYGPIKERLPLVHVIPSVSLEKILTSGKIEPSANSRVNKIRRTDGGLIDNNGEPVDTGTASRLEHTDIASELNTPMVHFSLGVPYYRPSFSANKKGLGLFHSCALIFDSNDIKSDYIYGNDSGSFVMNFQHGNNIPSGVNLEGMKLGSIEDAHKYINALFGSADAYLHGKTDVAPPKGTNPYAHFINGMLRNPLYEPKDAKEASVVVEVKTKDAVNIDKLKAIVMPSALILNPTVQDFLISHPDVKFRLYTTSPWVGPEECHAAVLNETYKIYRDTGIVPQVTTEKSHFSDIGSAVARIKSEREKLKANEGVSHA